MIDFKTKQSRLSKGQREERHLQNCSNHFLSPCTLLLRIQVLHSLLGRLLDHQTQFDFRLGNGMSGMRVSVFFFSLRYRFVVVSVMDSICCSFAFLSSRSSFCVCLLSAKHVFALFLHISSSAYRPSSFTVYCK